MSACPGTGAGWGSPPETWSTISPPGWVTPMCRSTKARRSSATWRRRDMPEPMGFFTDTTVCIGCKACEVACKEWNQLPAENGGVRGLGGGDHHETREMEGGSRADVSLLGQIQGASAGRRLA